MSATDESVTIPLFKKKKTFHHPIVEPPPFRISVYMYILYAYMNFKWERHYNQPQLLFPNFLT